MKIPLNTHALLWWLAGDDALSAAASGAIANEDNTVFVGAAFAPEITTKYRLGKLAGVATIVANVDAAIRDQGFSGLAVSVRHGQAAGALPGPHRDPFDRMLIARAMLDQLIVVSNEQPFDTYDVARL